MKIYNKDQVVPPEIKVTENDFPGVWLCLIDYDERNSGNPLCFLPKEEEFFSIDEDGTQVAFYFHSNCEGKAST
jgi:hypothetical protein